MAGVYKQVGMKIKQQRKWHRHSLDKLSWANTGLRFTARGLLRFCSHTLFSTTIISLKEQIAHKSQSSHVEQTWCGPKKKKTLRNLRELLKRVAQLAQRLKKMNTGERSAHAHLWSLLMEMMSYSVVLFEEVCIYEGSDTVMAAAVQQANLIPCLDPKWRLKLLIYVHVPQVCERKCKRGKKYIKIYGWLKKKEDVEIHRTQQWSILIT